LRTSKRPRVPVRPTFMKHDPAPPFAPVTVSEASLIQYSNTGFVDSYFSRNYIGATNNSIIRGAYHFARPSASSGAAQAQHFLAHGGKAHTLVTAVRFLTLRLQVGGAATESRSPEPSILKVPPPIIRKKIISHPKSLYSYSGNCSGLSASQMVAWIKDFSNTYHSKTKR
jgi:hypothetical protein